MMNWSREGSQQGWRANEGERRGSFVLRHRTTRTGCGGFIPNLESVLPQARVACCLPDIFDGGERFTIYLQVGNRKWSVYGPNQA